MEDCEVCGEEEVVCGWVGRMRSVCGRRWGRLLWGRERVDVEGEEDLGGWEDVVSAGSE